MDKKWMRRRKRVLEIIEVGSDFDYPSRAYDLVNASSIVLNLLVSILYTFSEVRALIGPGLVWMERITVLFFTIDYVLRIWTAKYLYPEVSEREAILKYVCSFTGLVDLLSFFPYYLPIFFPTGTVTFRMIRIVRIFRLFRINAYHDSLSVIGDVINGKRQQLVSSVFIIIILMIASSLCMYSLEHEAQPDVFTNAFSGLWWVASTLLTVGYGDIYPVTELGKVFGIFITFLGVGMVAIPTGIISAGFVEQYSSIKKRTEYGYEEDMHFIKIHLKENDKWVGKTVAQLQLPEGVIMAVIKRKDQVIIPRGDVELFAGDRVVLGAEPFEQHEHIVLKEIVLRQNNPWTGVRIRDLDISRHSIIVLVKRKNKSLIPNGKMFLYEGDHVFLYTRLHLHDASNIEI